MAIEMIEVGTQGPRGPQGDAGADGANGADGADGADGVGVPALGSPTQVLRVSESATPVAEWSDDRVPQIGDGTFTAVNATAFIAGFAEARGTITAGRTYVWPGYGTYIYNGSAFGHAFEGGVIDASGDGSMAHGRTWTASWYVQGQSNAGIFATGNSSHASGGASSNGIGQAEIRAYGSGSFAGGSVSNAWASDGLAQVYAYGWGSHASGVGMTHNANQASSIVRAMGEGSFAHGRTNGSSGSAIIDASGKGSVALGFADSSLITASGHGSFAVGRTYGPITASADNSAQFGPGVNAQADSLSVGTGPRLKGTVGAPSTPRNGDIWVANNYTYIRTNGVSRKIV